MDVQTKYPFEDFQICVDFADVLGDGEHLDDGNSDVYAYDEDGDDVTATLISNVTWNDEDMSFFLGGGNRWERYEIQIQTTTTDVVNVQKFEKRIMVVGWALVTLTEMLAYIKPSPPSSDHILLLSLIAGATDMIERACLYPPDWHIVETKHDDELYDGSKCWNGTQFWLRQNPIIYVESLYDDDLTEIRERKWRSANAYTSTGMTISASLPDGFEFDDQDAWNKKQIEVRAAGSTYKGMSFTSASIGTKESATEVTWTDNGWSAGTPSDSEKWRFSTGFRLYDKEGRIYYPNGFTSGTQNLRATYRAGYRVPPADLSNICKKLVAKVYGNRDKAGLKSERIGNYSYTLFSEHLSDEDEKILFPYKLMDVV